MRKKLISTLMLLVIFITACSNEPKSVWDRKTVAFIGDSITEETFFEHKEYPKIVKSNLGLSSIKSYAVSGGSLCMRNEELDSSYKPLVNSWEDIKESDVMFLLIGTNDYSNNVPLGEVNSQNPKEFNGCLNIVLGGLKEKYPESTIIVSSILKRKDNNLTLSVNDYNEILKSKTDEYGLLFFDGFNIDGLDIGNDSEHKITKDNLHPNKVGAKLLGDRISDFLISSVE